MTAFPDESPGSTESFAELLRYFRVRSGLSQVDLAILARLSARTISDLERGVRRRAYLPTVQALSVALGLSPEERMRFAATVQRARARRTEAMTTETNRLTELPRMSSSFVGRERELARLTAMLLAGHYRLLTVTGPPGVGKSRLAIETARKLATEHGFRVHYLALAGTAAYHQRLASLIAATEVLPAEREGGDGAVQPTLLVLDNLERLSTAQSDIPEVLRRFPGLRILATSRVASMVEGEHELNLTPLSLVDGGAGDENAPGDPAASPAVSMFMELRSQEKGAEAIESSDTIQAIVRQLDGLPLGIEVAAEQTRDFSLEALTTPSEQDWEIAVEALMEAERAVQVSTEESYQLLSPEDQWAFRRLGLLLGEWTLDDAVDLLMSDTQPGLPNLTGRQAYGMLHRIAQHSLVQLDVRGIAVHFRMLGPIRGYALILLEREGELDIACTAMASCGMRLSEDALGGLEGGDAHLWRRLLTQRTATFETVLEDSVRRDDGDTAGTMLWNLRRVLVEGFYSDADRWVSRALTCSERTPTTEGKLLVLAACFRAKRGYRAGAWRFAKRGLTLLTLRPWDRIEALSLLPPNLASLVPAEPGEAASDAV